MSFVASAASSLILAAEEGKVVFRGLPAGRYVVRTSGRMDDQMTVTVPGASVVKFEPEVVVTSKKLSLTR